MKCSKCGYKFPYHEGYVELENGTILDESCFFDVALEKLNAKQKNYTNEDYEDLED